MELFSALLPGRLLFTVAKLQDSNLSIHQECAVYSRCTCMCHSYHGWKHSCTESQRDCPTLWLGHWIGFQRRRSPSRCSQCLLSCVERCSGSNASSHKPSERQKDQFYWQYSCWAHNCKRGWTTLETRPSGTWW
jgi:hypothetical protein